MRMVRALVRVGWLTFAYSASSSGCPQQNSATASQKSDVEARVLVTISTKNGGRLPTVGKDDILVRDDKHPVQVTELRSMKNEPLIFSLLVDISGSMRRIGSSENAAAERIFDSLSGPGNQGHLLLFNDSAYNRFGDGVMDAASAGRELRFHDWRGSTALYDAIIQAVPQVTSSKNADSLRRLIIVLSDGDDDSSRSSFGGALGALQRFGIPLVGVYIRDPAFARDPNSKVAEKEGFKRFRELCEYSGGTLVNDPESVVPDIQNYLESQHLLSFTPSPESPNDLHMLEVKCKLSDCAVSAAAWYFAP